MTALTADEITQYLKDDVEAELTQKYAERLRQLSIEDRDLVASVLMDQVQALIKQTLQSC